MITVWNRKELLCTFDIQKQAEIRQILADAGIDYKTTVRGRGLMEGRRMGTLGEKQEWNTEYIVYVKKDDWERAKALFR